MGIRKIIYGLLQLGAESTATTQTTAVIQSLSGSLALVPSGSGAITANIPDGTAVGGNARGTYSVDLQTQRTLANQVATDPYCVIIGGQNNKIAMTGGETHGTILGGLGNIVSRQYAIAGGASCTASGQNSIALGDSNTASGRRAFTAGFGNNASQESSVALGNSNTASGQYSIVGGFSNTASGNRSVAFGNNSTANGLNGIALGDTVTASGQASFGTNGRTQASGIYSSAFGYFSSAYLSAQQSLSSGIFVAVGDAQQSKVTSFRQATLTTAQTASLSLDGTGTTSLIIPSGTNRTWNTTVNWVATVTGSSGTTTGVTVGDSIYGVSEFGFKVSASIASITPLIRDSIVADTTIMETATLTYATGSSNSLAMTFTAPTFAGGGSLGMRVVAKVSLVELGW